MTKKIATMISLAALILIFIFSSLLFFRTRGEYKADQDTYNKIQNMATDKNGVNFKKLKKINKDIVGWIKLKDTVIDYPIVKSPNHEKYLHTKFDGTYGGCGTLFTDYRMSPFKDMNTIIYGHHMKDGSMFNCLKYFKDRNWAEKHRKFTLTTPSRKYHAEVVTLLHVKAGSEIYQLLSFDTQEKKEQFIDLIKEKAQYLLTEPDINDKYISLSTCAYEFKNARYVVVCKLRPYSEKENKRENSEYKHKIKILNAIFKLRKQHLLAE